MLALRLIVPVLCVLALPASAAASDVTSDGTTIAWTAAAAGGEANVLVIEPDGALARVTDTVGVVAAGNCTQVDPNAATCPLETVTQVTIAGGDLDDTVTCRGLTVPCALDAGAGNDTLVGGTGSQAFSGGDGTDTLGATYVAAAGAVTVTQDGAANDGIEGELDNVGADVEIVEGSPNADTLMGGPGPNQLLGGDGDDVLDGGEGSDRLDGGAGEDTADYRARAIAVLVDTDDTADDGAAGEADDVRSDVERVLGGGGDDTLTAAEVDGGGGGDVLTAADAQGGPGDDRLVNAAGAQVLRGGEGTDTASYAGAVTDLQISLDGVANDGDGDGDNVGPDGDVERVIGGDGADTLTGNDAANRLEGGAGLDVLTGAAGADGLVGGGGNDSLDGGAGTDTLAGGDADDDLVGGADADVLNGDAGDDSLDGGLGADVVTGGAGDRDAATYADRTVRIDAVIGGGPVSGNADDGPAGARDALDVERVVGGSGGDRLTGVGGSHGFDGGPGDDVISSRDGDVDTAFCGAGTDDAVVDPSDFVLNDCERIDRGNATTPPGGSPPPSSTPPPGGTPPPPVQPPPEPLPLAAALVRGQTLDAFRSKGLRVRVTCPGACRVRARILVSRRTARRLGVKKGVEIARGSVELAAAGRATAVVKAPARVKRRLKRLQTLKATLETRITRSGAQATTKRRSFTLRKKRGL